MALEIQREGCQPKRTRLNRSQPSRSKALDWPAKSTAGETSMLGSWSSSAMRSMVVRAPPKMTRHKSCESSGGRGKEARC